VAAVRLELPGEGLHRFGFYRSTRDGAFLPEETRALDCISPHLQAVATICQSSLERRTEDCSSLFSRNGVAALKLGRDGRVLESNPAADVFVSDLFRLSRGRIMLPMRSEQEELDRAIATALSDDPAPTMFRVHSANRVRPPFLLMIPVRGAAREVFARTMAFLVIVESTQPHSVPQECLELLGRSLSLTPREQSVVGVVASGQDLSSAAQRFDITIGTARNHLKSAMQKANIHSQVELAALVATLSDLVAA
jgi:DNA-binding CsgD family transcriptional regulator